jgi:hypothetical protein
MRLAARYVTLIAGVVAWFVLFNVAYDRNKLAAVAFGLVSVVAYGYRRWRTPNAITKTDAGVRISTNGRPVVVEFYADL